MAPTTAAEHVGQVSFDLKGLEFSRFYICDEKVFWRPTIPLHHAPMPVKPIADATFADINDIILTAFRPAEENVDAGRVWTHAPNVSKCRPTAFPQPKPVHPVQSSYIKSPYTSAFGDPETVELPGRYAPSLCIELTGFAFGEIPIVLLIPHLLKFSHIPSKPKRPAYKYEAD